MKGAGPRARSFRRSAGSLADAGWRLDLAGDDLLLQGVHLRDPRLRDPCPLADLADGDAPVLQVEDEVAAAHVAPAGLDAPDGEEHTGVHPLDGAREDVLAEERLVDVDADAPAAALLRGV